MQTTLDLRSFQSNSRNEMLLTAFAALADGEIFRFISDVDPESLRREFVKAHFDQMIWISHPLKDGTWEVEVGKLQAKQEHGCCGICGGGNHN